MTDPTIREGAEEFLALMKLSVEQEMRERGHCKFSACVLATVDPETFLPHTEPHVMVLEAGNPKDINSFDNRMQFYCMIKMLALKTCAIGVSLTSEMWVVDSPTGEIPQGNLKDIPGRREMVGITMCASDFKTTVGAEIHREPGKPVTLGAWEVLVSNDSGFKDGPVMDLMPNPRLMEMYQMMLHSLPPATAKKLFDEVFAKSAMGRAAANIVMVKATEDSPVDPNTLN